MKVQHGEQLDNKIPVYRLLGFLCSILIWDHLSTEHLQCWKTTNFNMQLLDGFS